MIRQIILVLVAFLLAGCVGGYVLPQAEARIEFASVSEAEAAQQTIQAALQERGFLLQPNRPFPEELTEDWPLDRKWRDQQEVSLTLNRSGGEDLMAYIIPFPTAETFSDLPVQGHFPILELRFVENRPGGFSADGHRIHAELLSFLRQQGYRLVVVSKPPATDDEEYVRVRLGVMTTIVVFWLVAWAFGALTVGAFANWLTRRLRMKQTTRRVIFVVVGAVLIAPLPFPAASVSVILLPGALWWLSDVTSYARFMLELPVSALASGALSVVVAMLLIRDEKMTSAAQREVVQ